MLQAHATPLPRRSTLSLLCLPQPTVGRVVGCWVPLVGRCTGVGPSAVVGVGKAVGRTAGSKEVGSLGTCAGTSVHPDNRCSTLSQI